MIAKGVAKTPQPMIEFQSQPQTTMSNAFTDNVQIDETWEIPTNLDLVLAEVDAILCDSFGMGSGDFTSSGESEWATDAAVEGILNQMDPETIAAMIADLWDPTL